MNEQLIALAKSYQKIGRNGLIAVGLFTLILVVLCIDEGLPSDDVLAVFIAVILGAGLFFFNLYRIRRRLSKIAKIDEDTEEELLELQFKDFHRDYLFFAVPLLIVALIGVLISLVLCADFYAELQRWYNGY